jgi:hypothetical protein
VSRVFQVMHARYWLLSGLVACTQAPAAVRPPPVAKPKAIVTVSDPGPPVCLSPVPAEVEFEPVPGGSLIELQDVPFVTVANSARFVEGVPMTLHVEVAVPSTFTKKPIAGGFLGFNAEYPSRLTTESAGGVVATPKLLAKKDGADSAASWSANKLTFDVRFTPSSTPPSGGRVSFIGHLRFGLCSDTACTNESAKLTWSSPALGTGASSGPKLTVAHKFANANQDDPHRHDWIALLPVSLYPADDTCILFDLASMTFGHKTVFSTRNREALRPYAACTSRDDIELRAPPGEYFLLAGATGHSWWTNWSIRRRVVVGSSDQRIELTEHDMNQDNCGG